MRVIVKEVGKEAYETEIQKTLEAMQAVVGGWIEAYPIWEYNRNQIFLICDEEGRYKYNKNCVINGNVFYGTLFLCGVEGEDFGDCPVSLELAKIMFSGLQKK